MKLTELEPQFLTRERNYVHQIEKASGITFLCPVCIAKGGSNGTHSILCWFTGKVPPDWTPGPGRWNPQGTGYQDLSFVEPGATSILINGGCNAHFHIRNGEIIPA